MTVGSAFGPAASSCPCGSERVYAACCGLLHHGEAAAETAEQLMRSRYSAFAVGDVAYLVRTWHPRTRPRGLELDASRRWDRLEILRSDRGGPRDTEGVVEFRAHYADDRATGTRGGSQHEVSRFVRVGGRWLYLDALR
jgi:SEC-C motif-containing protein